MVLHNSAHLELVIYPLASTSQILGSQVYVNMLSFFFLIFLQLSDVYIEKGLSISLSNACFVLGASGRGRKICMKRWCFDENSHRAHREGM